MTVGTRRLIRGIGDFLKEAVGEIVAEAILGVLACALLGGLALIAYLSWSLSPRLTVAGAGLSAVLLAHGAWQHSGRTRKERRRGFAALTAAAFTLAAATTLFLLLYADGCGCL
ncbi:lysine transporter LysE [Streptomyces sp. NPDC051784]|uniref:lysine transporter LysE n=1 Tax=Streptomyces sp. NPDC051784 TaxID=3155805 RepID=UPI003424B424